VTSTRVILAAGALLGVMALPRAVAACSCGFSNTLLAPSRGATDVPLNARLWVGGGHDGGLEFVLFGPEPEPLAARRGVIETTQGPLLVFTPDEIFEPHTHYELWQCAVMQCRERLLEFTTGDEVDESPPPVPELVGQSSERDDGAGIICPRSRWVELDVLHEGLLVIDHAERFDVDLSRDGALGEAYLITLDPNHELGDKGCSSGWPGGREAEVRFGAFDIAGNFSGLGPPEVLELGCGCRTDGSPPPIGVLAFSLLLALQVKRRR
jgi:MYXO-CTERM domain-containing protein